MTEEKTTPKVAVGYWRTRSGDKAYVAWCGVNPFTEKAQVLGFVKNNYVTALSTWFADGSHGGNIPEWSLIEPWRDKVSGTAYAVLFGDELHSFLKDKPVAISGECRLVKVRYEEIEE